MGRGQAVVKTEAACDRRAFLKSFPRYFARRALEAWKGFQGTAARVAQVDVTTCVAWTGLSCQLCYLACPRRGRAIFMEDQKPVVVAQECDGCALCEAACKTVNLPPAIRMV